MRTVFSGCQWLGAALLAMPLMVAAQAIDSGALQRQQNPSPGQGDDRNAQLPVQPAAPLQVQPSGAASPGNADARVDRGETLVVNRFALSKPTDLISEVELNATLSDFLGRPNSLEDLDRATVRIVESLRAEGYHFAVVHVPPQEVVNGVVALQVESGVLAAVKTRGLSRLGEKHAQALVSSALGDDGHFNLAQVERGLLLLNDLPGVHGTGLVVPGEEPGTLELSLDMREEDLAGGWFSTDNYGSRSTGTLRAAGDLRLNNPGGHGDIAELYGAVSRHTGSLTLSYATPLGHTGLRARVAGSYMGYTLGNAFAALEGEGRSRWLSAGLSHPLIRGRTLNLSINGTVEYKKLEDRALGVNLSDRHSHAVSLGVRGNHLQGAATRAFDYSATLSSGRLNRDGNNIDLLLDQLTRQTNGGFTILRLTGQWVENISRRFSLAATGEMQWSGGNLDSSEKLYMGGPRGVRAFPIEEAGSDEGQVLAMEARWFAGQWAQLGGQAWTVLGFIDLGHATRNRDPWLGWNAAHPDLQNTYWLKGIGVGTRAQIGRRTEFELMAAHRIGGNPGADAAGLDADGHSSRNRLWLNASLAF